jgi:hypothetical protein
MPSRSWHWAKAQHNKAVADHLHGETEFDDWAVTALFYSALHAAHSVIADEPKLAKDERHPRKHSSPGRDGDGGRGTNQLVREFFPGPIHRQYRDLYEASRRTRYDHRALGSPYARYLAMCLEVHRYAQMMHMARPILPTDRP